MHRKQHNEGKSKKWLWITLTVAVIVLVGISAYLGNYITFTVETLNLWNLLYISK